MHKTHKNFLGFTIVELLAVIAIILLLVALLMPTLSRIRESAKQTKCMSNMRQLGMAAFVYAADYDGFAPYSADALKPSNEDMFTARSKDSSHTSYKVDYPKNKWFAEYLPGGGLGTMNPVAYCPSGGRLGPLGPSVQNSSNPQYPHANISYGINPDLVVRRWFYENFDSGGDERRCVPLSQVFNPAKVCLWIESTLGHCYSNDMDMTAVTGPHFSKKKEPFLFRPVVGTYPVFRNLGKANVMYVDQHMTSKRVPEEIPDHNTQFWNHTATKKPDPYEK